MSRCCNCTAWAASLSPLVLLAVFGTINILNYLDRGIVPGVPESLGSFIRSSEHLPNGTSTDAYLGGLQSSFIGGYSVASISFGHLVHRYPPFKLMCVGLIIWVVAVVLSGLAPNFWVMVAARVLSGVGEASFQTVVPPYIDDNAPNNQRGLWLSAFYLAIPVGTAAGYGFGSGLDKVWSWRWAFILEAVPMLPLIALMWVVPYSRKRREVIREVEDALEHDAGEVSSPAGKTGTTATRLGTPQRGGKAASASVLSSGVGTYVSPKPEMMAPSTPPAAGAAALVPYDATAAAALAAGGAPGASDATPLLGGGQASRGSDPVARIRGPHSRGASGDSAGLHAAFGGDPSLPVGSLAAGAALAASPRRSPSAGAPGAGAASYGTISGVAGGEPAAGGSSLPGHSHPHLHVHASTHYPHHIPPTESELTREVNEELRAEGDVAALNDTAVGKPSFLTELVTALTNPIYVSIVLGYAGFTAVVAGISTFAPTFIIGLNLVSDQFTASISAGGVAAAAGIIGVPLGGYLIDVGQARAKARMRGMAKPASGFARLLETPPASAADVPPLPEWHSERAGSARFATAPVASASGMSRSSDALLPRGGAPAGDASRSSLRLGGGAFAPPSRPLSARAPSDDDGDISRGSSRHGLLVPSEAATTTAAFPQLGSGSASAAIGMRQSTGGSDRPAGAGEPAALGGSSAPRPPLAPLALPSGGGGGRAASGSVALEIVTSGEDAAAGEEEEEESATSPEMLDLKLSVAMPQCVVMSFAGTIVLVGSVFATLVGLPLFLVTLFVGIVLLMATTAGVNLAMMASVPAESRSFAIGMGTLMLHALGDVPSPPIIGLLASSFAPPHDCDADGNNCKRDSTGLRNTLLAASSWMVWPTLLWAVAWILAARQRSTRNSSGYYVQWEQSEIVRKRSRASTIASATGGARSARSASATPTHPSPVPPAPMQHSSVGSSADDGAYVALSGNGGGGRSSSPLSLSALSARGAYTASSFGGSAPPAGSVSAARVPGGGGVELHSVLGPTTVAGGGQ